MAEAGRLVPGLIGMSVHTDCVYLKEMARGAREHVQGTGPALNDVESLLHTIDFGALVAELSAGDWSEAERRISRAALSLEEGGADFLVVTSNTGNTLLGALSCVTELPVLDIAGVTWDNALSLGWARIGLLGTKMTCESGIYQEAAQLRGGSVIMPSAPVGDALHAAIFDSLIFGEVSDESLDAALAAIIEFEAHGADAVALACTDLTLAAERLQARSPLPLLDTAVLHARAAGRAAALGGPAARWTRGTSHGAVG